MKWMIALWVVVYTLVGAMVGVSYWIKHRPTFEADVAPITAQNVRGLQDIGRVWPSALGQTHFTQDDKLFWLTNVRIRVYDLNSGKYLGTLFAEEDCQGLWAHLGCFSLLGVLGTLPSFSDDDRYLAYMDYAPYGGNIEVRVWDIQQNELSAQIKLNNAANMLLFFPNSTTLIYHQPQSGLWRYDVETQIFHQLETDEPQFLLQVGQQRIYYLSMSGQVKALGADFQPEVVVDSPFAIDVFVVSPDERFAIYKRQADDVVMLLSLEDGRRQRLGKGEAFLRDAAFSNDGRYLFTTDERGVVYQWDTASGDLVRVLSNDYRSKWMFRMGVENDILIGRAGDQIYVWDINSGERLVQVSAGNWYGGGLFWLSPDGRFIVLEEGILLGVPNSS